MDYIFDKDYASQAEEAYLFMKDHIDKYGFVTLAQLDKFIGSYYLNRSYKNENDIGWTTMDNIEFGVREHEITYIDRDGKILHTGRYTRAMTLSMPDPKEITY